ncbi:metallophosphoesterase [Hydrogenibacillus schlegelii]|nr:bifunctional metallophosphatase/5'-nucleotidase [Hydrogenibacillus schlegelii]
MGDGPAPSSRGPAWRLARPPTGDDVVDIARRSIGAALRPASGGRPLNSAIRRRMLGSIGGMALRVTLIHSNDVHSRFDRMPKIAGYVERLRRERRGEAVFLLDGGDHIDRAHPLTEATTGGANVRALKASGYDFIAIGNNEGLSLLPKALDALYRGAPFDVLVANLFDRSGRRPAWARPFAVRTVGGRAIGFIGVTVPFFYYALLGWRVEPPEVALAELVPRLRPDVDALVLLSHLGLFADRELAKRFPALDVILGGHTHHRLPEGERVGRTTIIQAGRGGAEVGQVDLVFTSTGLVVRARTVAVDKEAPHPAVAAAIREAEAASAANLERPVARLARPLGVSYVAESPLANVLARAIRRATEADVAFVTSGLLLHGLSAGVVPYAAVLSACPHPISPCVLSLRALELKQILSDALRPSRMTAEVRGYGFRGRVLGHPAVDGIDVEVAEAGDRRAVVALLKDGRRLVDEEVLRVATADMFVFMRAYDGLHHRPETVTYCAPFYLRHYLAEELGRSVDHTEAERPRFRRRAQDAGGEGLGG